MEPVPYQAYKVSLFTLFLAVLTVYSLNGIHARCRLYRRHHFLPRRRLVLPVQPTLSLNQSKQMAGQGRSLRGLSQTPHAVILFLLQVILLLLQ